MTFKALPGLRPTYLNGPSPPIFLKHQQWSSGYQTLTIQPLKMASPRVCDFSVGTSTLWSKLFEEVRGAVFTYLQEQL